MRLIDAKSVLQGIEELKTSPFANPLNGEKRHLIQETLDIVACLVVKKEPTVDAVKVVRCKDCEFSDIRPEEERDMEKLGYRICKYHAGNKYVTNDWFCKGGTRRGKQQ